MIKDKSLNNIELSQYLSKQLNHFFPDNNIVEAEKLLEYINLAEERIFECFAGIHKKYFNEGNRVLFNHLQSDQYCMYLYMLYNYIYNYDNNTSLCTKLYYLNKSLHAVDIYFTAELPKIFLFVHPLGTILGRANFGNNFVAYQGCTIGCLNDGIFPTIGNNVIMYANSTVLGNSKIGNNVCIPAGVKIVNSIVPDDVIVFGEYPNYIFKKNTKNFWDRPPFKYE